VSQNVRSNSNSKLLIMLKNILNLNGAQELSKNAQKVITGGGPIQQQCGDGCDVNGCPSNEECIEFREGTLGNWTSCWRCVDPANYK
jgi:hypothetical protein